MKPRQLKQMGISRGDAVRIAVDGVKSARKAKVSLETIHQRLRELIARPGDHLLDPHFGLLAAELDRQKEAQASFEERARPAPWKVWGTDIDKASLQQMENACALPVSVRGALMPDAHVGYGLPIGGVLATRDAVIPYAVGVDIACRMKMSILDLPLRYIDKRTPDLARAIESETRFGIGCSFKRRREHPVIDEDWSRSKVTASLKDKAWAQLGTSGSGNHFVEFGVIEIQDERLGPAPGRYVALLSHSGSRGAGATIASHFSKLAMSLRPELPPRLRHLAWLELSSQEGREYWDAMELMGKYAAANHACIHRHVTRFLGAHVVLDLENHHNFAWKEVHDGEELIVHRKGATPAGAGVRGIIPGSMATPTYVVEGKGSYESLRSAAHGAGRVMSRTQARRTFRWNQVRGLLEARGVRLLSAGLDEVPMVYKDIDQVMEAQKDLVEPLARFEPRVVKMAPDGEKAED